MCTSYLVKKIRQALHYPNSLCTIHFSQKHQDLVHFTERRIHPGSAYRARSECVYLVPQLHCLRWSRTRFLGSSGQNINDIFRYMVEADGDARLRTACRTLDWGHIAPTCPDTLCECLHLLRECFMKLKRLQ